MYNNDMFNMHILNITALFYDYLLTFKVSFVLTLHFITFAMLSLRSKIDSIIKFPWLLSKGIFSSPTEI